MRSHIMLGTNSINCYRHQIEMKEHTVLTCRWIKTTDPSSLQVPPCRSTWSIRKICRNRIPRIADVANTCPLEPNVRTTIEATTTIKSENITKLFGFVAKKAQTVLTYLMEIKLQYAWAPISREKIQTLS